MKTSVRDKKSVFMLFRGDNIMLGKYNFVCSFVRVTDNWIKFSFYIIFNIKGKKPEKHAASVRDIYAFPIT